MFFHTISTETVPNVTGHHFFDVFAPSYFLITNMRVAIEEFFSVMHSCHCLTGLVLAALVLVLYIWSCSWSWSYSLGLGLKILVLFHHWTEHSMLTYTTSLHRHTAYVSLLLSIVCNFTKQTRSSATAQLSSSVRERKSHGATTTRLLDCINCIVCLQVSGS